MTSEKRKELFRTIKFTLISISAGLIQAGSFALLYGIIFKSSGGLYWVISYTVSVILSVIWNFTINRKYTFKSANNVPKAMLLVLAFYLVFTPATILLGAFLFNGEIMPGLTLANHLNWNEYLVTGINMVLNLILEYLYDRFVVFRDTIDTNDVAKKSESSLSESSLSESSHEKVDKNLEETK